VDLPALDLWTTPSRTATTNDAGVYQFDAVPAGRWRVKFTGVSPSAVATVKRAPGVLAAVDSDVGPSLESELVTVRGGTTTSDVGGGVWDCLAERRVYSVVGSPGRIDYWGQVTYTDGGTEQLKMESGDTLDARAANWNVPWGTPGSVQPVKFEAPVLPVVDTCMVGGDVQIDLADDAPWERGWPFQFTNTPARYTDINCSSNCDDRKKFWKTTAGVVVYRAGFNLVGANIHDIGDGVILEAGANNWSVRGARVARAHDDCVQNDAYASGSVDDTLFDGCYVFFSVRGPGTGNAQQIAITNSLIHVEDFPTHFCQEASRGPDGGTLDRYNPPVPPEYPLSSGSCRPTGPAPGTNAISAYGPAHGMFWKYRPDQPAGLAPKIAVRNNIFYAESEAVHGNMGFPQYDTAGTPSVYSDDLPYIDYDDPEQCSNNVILWGGPASSLPAELKPVSGWEASATKLDNWPKCYTVLASGDGSVIDAAWSDHRQRWLDRKAPGGGFVPLTTPRRVFDSRDTVTYPGGAITDEPRTITVPIGAGIPAASDIGGLVVNVTATDATNGTFVRMWGSGPQPTTSSINVLPTETRANGATIAPGTGAGGAPTLQAVSAVGSVNVVVDVVGFYRKSANPADQVYLPASAPVRLIDTRLPGGTGPPLAAGVARFVPVPSTGPTAVPVNATAILANVTLVEPTAQTHLKAFPASLATVTPTTVNAPAGAIVPNQTIIKLGGKNAAPDAGVRGIKLLNNQGSSHAVVDVVGWFVPNGTAGGLHYYPVTPTRVLDTRSVALSGSTSPLAAGVPRPLQLRRGPGSGAKVANLNVTVTQGTATGYLRAYPTPSALPPDASISNWTTGLTVANGATVKLGDNRVATDIGKSTFLSTSSDVHVIADLTGYFAPPNQIPRNP